VGANRKGVDLALDIGLLVAQGGDLVIQRAQFQAQEGGALGSRQCALGAAAQIVVDPGRGAPVARVAKGGE
jgi:hypothetical protein